MARKRRALAAGGDLLLGTSRMRLRSKDLDGVIAKRRASLYGPGPTLGRLGKNAYKRGTRACHSGHVRAPKNFDSLIVGYYVARVRNGFVPALRAKVFERFGKLEIKTCSFANLPQRDKGRWGQGLTAEKMAECRWLKPQLVAQIEYADWTNVNHLRHSKFISPA